VICLPSDKEYLDFLLDQLNGIDDIASRKMMGEYILYYREKVFGGIYDNRFLVKITEAGKNLMPDCRKEIPYEGAKPMFLVEEIENRDFLKELITKMYDELPDIKKKRKRVVK
jgi:TfoX/Sxy family transcriptional regulator of competence genes